MSASIPVRRAERLSTLSRHSSALDASASAGSGPTIPEKPLTRRELREREREREATVQAPVVVPATAVELTPAADLLVAAEMNEPDIEPAVVTESDREIAAPPIAQARATAFELLMAPESTETTTTSTEIPLPTRASLRTTKQTARSGRSRRPILASPPVTARSAPSRAPALASAPAPAPVSPRVQPRRGRVSTFAAKGATIAAMAFVALMAVSTSLPAEALLSSADVQAAALEAQRPTQSEPAQSIELAEGAGTVTVERDGYEAQTITEYAAATGIRMEATFTNNPNGTIQWPFAVGVHIGDNFGYRNCSGCSSDHQGQDFNPGVGAPIQSIADGVVSFAEDGEGSLGVNMMIDHMINGELVTSVYAHMISGSMLFKAGDVVKVGQVIGKVGSTGMSTGPHLHFEIRIGGQAGVKADPLEWLYANTN